MLKLGAANLKHTEFVFSWSQKTLFLYCQFQNYKFYYQNQVIIHRKRSDELLNRLGIECVENKSVCYVIEKKEKQH